MSKYYKLFCKDLDEIISIKTYSATKEAKVYESFRDFISKVPSSFSVSAYKRKVVDTLLVDPAAYYHVFEIESNEELELEITNALYTTIIEAYPHFEFEFVCNDINNMIALDQMRSVITKHIEGMAEVTKTKKSTKALSSFGDLVKLTRKLNKEIVGQEDACEKTINAVKLLIAGIADFSALFYVGPTGVGKTKLAKVLGDHYTGNYLKINCGEFSSAHDYAKLIGAPPGYVGHTETSLLAEKAQKSNSWVILFDEIEKANPKFYDFLLSLLDDGTCTDNMGNVLDFSKSVFIFTTNQGIQDSKLGDRKVGFGSDIFAYEDSHDLILQSIKRNFNPEFLNRIDHFIFFNRLKENDLRKIARIEMSALPVKRTHSLVNYVVKNSNHEEYGARDIAKFIKNNIATKVADAILKKQLPLEESKYYIMKVEKDNLFISNIEEEDHGWKNSQTS